MEKWVNIYHGLYAVSNLGRIKSNERDVYTITGKRHYSEKILKPEITRDNHLRVVLSVDGEKHRFLVHRLVAYVFLPNPYNLPVINHKDENPMNNCVDNLEWCTIQYNNTYNNLHYRRGDVEGHTVIVFNENHQIIDELPSITKTAKKYNISLTTLFRRTKDGKMCKGYYFQKDIKSNDYLERE